MIRLKHLDSYVSLFNPETIPSEVSVISKLKSKKQPIREESLASEEVIITITSPVQQPPRIPLKLPEK